MLHVPPTKPYRENHRKLCLGEGLYCHISPEVLLRLSEVTYAHNA